MTARTRVELDGRAIGRVASAAVRGIAKVLAETAAQASRNAPDRSPHGEGLVDAWGWLVFENGRAVDQGSGDGSSVQAPSDFQPGEGVVGVVGFDRPGRFVEVGTSDTPAQPFLSPAMESVMSRAPEIVGAELAAELRRL